MLVTFRCNKLHQESRIAVNQNKNDIALNYLNCMHIL